MEAASRRNCRSVHQPNPEHGSAEAEGNGGHSAGGEQGGGEGFLGQLRNVCSRLIGGGAGGGGVDASNSTGEHCVLMCVCVCVSSNLCVHAHHWSRRRMESGNVSNIGDESMHARS
eukprot:scaffold228571_cov17-Tisochrysis_lutea.AAC.1